jgi:hypothetical protein
LSEESKDWFQKINEIIQAKINEEKENDIINDFFGVLNTLYNQNKIYTSD